MLYCQQIRLRDVLTLKFTKIKMIFKKFLRMKVTTLFLSEKKKIK